MATWGHTPMSKPMLHSAMKVLASQVCWRLALQLGTSPASDVALLNQAATVAVRAERWQEALALLSNGDTDGVAALGVALDAAQKGLAWQLALQALGTRLEAGSNVVSWNAACGACVGHWEVVLNLLEEMVTRNMSPDVVSYTVAVTACAQQLRWQQILVLLEKSGGGDPVTIWHAWRSHEALMRQLPGFYAAVSLRKTLQRLANAEDWQTGFNLAVLSSQLLWPSLSSMELQHIASRLYRPVRERFRRPDGDDPDGSFTVPGVLL
ncbi:Uncharacterized protein SCF082_LOCUS6700 [Durusdinium trenchii]|uniref:Pentatricopeptide repeat-containing protein, chloroplastic n=2 Tax=Durusdinium trenchii TaxID=1381693 RepID=A0ABP0IE78_9DINO